MFFFKKRISKVHFWYNISWALVLCSRLVIIAPHSTPKDQLDAFSVVYDHHQGWGQWIYQFVSRQKAWHFYQIWESTDPDLRCGKMCGTVPCIFIACYPRWCAYCPSNASGQSLGVLWKLCGSSGTVERVHRRCCTRHRFWDTFFEKTCIFRSWISF